MKKSEKRIRKEKELKDQVENYHNIRFSKSKKGQVIIFFIVVLLFSALVGLLAPELISLSSILWTMMIYIPILFFVYKGHRWALVTLALLWSAEKFITLLFQTRIGNSGGSSIIWWLIGIALIYEAFRVENKRKNSKTTKELSGQFCTNCGNNQKNKANFCIYCGNKNT